MAVARVGCSAETLNFKSFKTTKKSFTWDDSLSAFVTISINCLKEFFAYSEEGIDITKLFK